MTSDATPANTATPPNEDVFSKLNGLIKICKDGQDGFKDAAEGLTGSDLKTIFYGYSQPRSEFKGVLQELVHSLGGDPENANTFFAALHRGWMESKSAVTGKNEEAILNKCGPAEDCAKAATPLYRDVLELGQTI